MSKKSNEVLSYFENLYKNKAVYLWGANGVTITKTLTDNLYRAYGSITYNKIYYDDKLKEGQGRIGADCSGAMFPMSGFDTTTKNYYSKCVTKGNIAQIPNDKVCLVFKGASTSTINHIGLYCGNGYVIEMKSSKDNCVKDVLIGKGWKWYGIPSWIDYSSSTSNTNNKFIKCIDVSSHQGDINWNLVKSGGVNYAILKVIRKDLNADVKFEEYSTGCKNAGIELKGVYNYSYATSVNKAVTDAKKVLSVLNGRKVKIWLDVEDDCQKNLGTLLTDIINAYQKVIEDAGYEFGVYTGLSFYRSFIKPHSHLVKCNDWWIARYYNGSNKTSLTVDPNEQYKPDIDRDIWGWQYTSSGQVPGINGSVDINVVYNTFNSDKPIITSPTLSETSITLMGKIATNSGILNIRSEPDNNSNKVGSYAKGDCVQLIAQTSNGWYRTNKGYISSTYVKGAIGQVYNCSKLNLRSTPESNPAVYNIIETLEPTNEIALLKEENGWYKARLDDGTVGWVSKKYIRII